MSKLKFKANNWLHSHSIKNSSSQSSKVPPLHYTKPHTENHFPLKNFLIPGWCGDSLISRHALSVKKILEALKKDALFKFDGFHRHTNTMKNSIYREFLSYIEANSITISGITSQHEFWNQILDKKSKNARVLNTFKDLYCFRVSTTYLYKIRFFQALAKEVSIPLGQNDLLNPSSFISKIFKRGSQYELNCEALKTNIYSWYRPSAYLEDRLKDLTKEFHLLSITEFMKLCTYQDEKRLGDTSSDQNLNFEGHDFSHSLSHKSFGHFLNHLIIKLPNWFENKSQDKKEQHININDFLRPSMLSESNKPFSLINTKFEGDALGPICHSYWVASGSQKQNNEYFSRDVVCPDFIDDSFTYGRYTQICHELKFLTSLVEEASLKSENPISFISNVYKEKNLRTAMDDVGQLSMLTGTEGKSSKQVYERIILNLIKLPKSNQHYHLLNKISEQINSLHQKGFLYIFSNQNLFVPSQSEKVNGLLDKIKLVSYINLEDLKGKGEIPNFLYILKKRKKSRINKNKSPIESFSRSEKEECMRFNWSGNLSRFAKFEILNNELKMFFSEKKAVTTPLYQNDLEDGINFNFHHDAILDGKLVGLEGPDSSRITHPSFFKNLTQTCVPFENFFSLENLNTKSNENKKNYLTSELLGITLKQEEKFSLLLMINYTDHSNVSLEISDIDTYQHKLTKNGSAYFEYFGLNPKRRDINLNMFREFFDGPLGKQIIQLSLGRSSKQSKSKLNALLIPRFFMNPNILSKDEERYFSYLKLSKDEILKSHPNDLNRNFNSIEELLSGKAKEYPWHIIGLMTYFKGQLTEALEAIHDNQGPKKHKINFENPLIISGITKLKLLRVFPGNEHIFISTPVDNPQDVYLKLTSTKICKSDDNYSLQLLSDQLVVAELYSKEALLLFADFLLGSAIGSPISSTLQNLHLPGPDDLQLVLKEFEVLEEELLQQIKKLQQLIFNTFTYHINQ